MPFDGNGNYIPPAPEFPAVSGEVIYASDFNTIINDVAAALTTCITKDGQSGVTANIDFGGNRLVHVADGVSADDVVTMAQVFTNPTFTTTTAEGMLVQGTGLTVTVSNMDLLSATVHVVLAAPGDSSDAPASTEFVATELAAAVGDIDVDLAAETAARIAEDALLAPLASPALTGTPTAPEPASGTDTSQLATCHFVIQQAFATVLPNQAGNSGKVLSTNGLDASWVESTSRGDVLFSIRTLDFPLFLPCDGSTYAASSYPDLWQMFVDGPGVAPEIVEAALAAGALSKVAMSPDGEYLLGNSGSTLYARKYDSGAWSTLTTPTAGSTTLTDTAVSTDGIYACTTWATSTYKAIYKLTGTTYAAIAAPATLAASHTGCSFSANADLLAFSINSFPGVKIYTRSGDTFTAATDPSSPTTTNGVCVDVTQAGDYFVYGRSSSPYIEVYKNTGAGVFTGLGALPDAPAVAPVSVSFSPDGSTVFAVYGSGTKFYAWKRTGDVFERLSVEDAGATNMTNARAKSSDDNSVVGLPTGDASGVIFYRRIGDTLVKQIGPDITTAVLNTTAVLFQPVAAGGRVLINGTVNGANQIRAFLYGPNTTVFPVPDITPLGGFNQVKGFIKS